MKKRPISGRLVLRQRKSHFDQLTLESLRLFIQRIEIAERAASAARSAVTGIGSTCIPVNSNRMISRFSNVAQQEFWREAVCGDLFSGSINMLYYKKIASDVIF